MNQNEKIVPISGHHGVGKSALARNTLHYLADRKLFAGGIIFIKLKENRTVFNLLKLIRIAIMNGLALDDNQTR